MNEQLQTILKWIFINMNTVDLESAVYLIFLTEYKLSTKVSKLYWNFPYHRDINMSPDRQMERRLMQLSQAQVQMSMLMSRSNSNPHAQ